MRFGLQVYSFTSDVHNPAAIHLLATDVMPQLRNAGSRQP